MFDLDFIKSSAAAVLGSVTAILLFVRFARPSLTLEDGLALVAAHKQKGRISDALAVAKELAALHPQNLRARLLFVQALIDSQQRVRARAEIEQLARQRPGNREVLELRAKLS